MAHECSNILPLLMDYRTSPIQPPKRESLKPLKRFADAKKCVGSIYSDLEACMNELLQFYTDVNGENIVPDEKRKEVQQFKESVIAIREIFERGAMKAVFFGGTSNGKSTVINAMLHSKVLPQGLGHTTSCFIQVEGSSDNERCIINENSSRINLSELHKFGNAMCDDNASSIVQDSLIRVLYPESESKLLQNDLVIVDSPGVDISPEVDNWIDKHCLDADVFVLVCNAESTLKQTEKSFFHRVSSKLSKPNIFILNNRWDALIAEEKIKQVKEQHLKRIEQFLVNELKVCSEYEAKRRIFFVSAREVLEARLKEKGSITEAYHVDGHRYRSIEFSAFESAFEETISQSAICTKFESHYHRAREIINDVQANLDLIQGYAMEKREKLHQEFALKGLSLKKSLSDWNEFESLANTELQCLKNEVYLKISADFHEEIYRLKSIMDNFDYRFDDEPALVTKYKMSLANFIDKIVSENLEVRCTGGLLQRIWNLESALFGRVSEIVPKDYSKKLEEVWRYRAPFRFLIWFNCPSLMENFHEDLNFRFSFGLSALIRRFIAYQSGQPITAINTRNFEAALGHHGSNQSSSSSRFPQSNEFVVQDGDVTEESELERNALVAKLVMSAAGYAANGGVGLLIAGGLISGALRWRIITAAGLIYGGIYAFEWWRWNSGAKEQHFKDQFCSHLAARMRSVAPAYTNHCESQVMREMQQVLGGLKSSTAGVHQEMKTDLDEMQEKVEKIDKIIKGLSTIKGKSSILNTDLDRFNSMFLEQN